MSESTPEVAGVKLKEVFSGTRGKVLIVGGVGALVYLWWTRGRNPSSDTDPSALADAFDTGASSGRGGESAPTVGNDTQGSSSTTGRPTTNAEWLSRGVDYLGTGSVAYTALSKALGGEQLTQAQYDMTSRVITAIGSPPDGMPPLQLSPAGDGKSNTLPAPTGVRVTATTKTTATITWNAVSGAGYYRVYRKDVKQNVGASDKPGVTVGGLSPGKTYYFAVAADTTTAKPGKLSGYVKGTTKK